MSAAPREILRRVIHLSTHVDALPVDWPALGAALRQIDEDGPGDHERAAVNAACSLAGLSPDQAQAAYWLLGDLSDARADLEALPPDDLAELLRELAADGDQEELVIALEVCPHDAPAYVAKLRELVETGDPSDTRPADPAAVRAEQIRALLACPKPGHTLTPGLAAAIVDAMAAWHRLKVETAEQRAIREAFARAHALMGQRGDRDPRTMDAVIKALELQDPGCCARMLAQGGLTMPTPTHCTAEGEPLYSLESLADALGADAGDLVAIAEELEAVGLEVRREAAGRLH
ncbi:MAG: hypothetical protein QG612_3031 [Pseudomonadota bacterium]|nr:hypothetical protein [Pseudomonadota bacterium]